MYTRIWRKPFKAEGPVVLKMYERDYRSGELINLLVIQNLELCR